MSCTCLLAGRRAGYLSGPGYYGTRLCSANRRGLSAVPGWARSPQQASTTGREEKKGGPLGGRRGKGRFLNAPGPGTVFVPAGRDWRALRAVYCGHQYCGLLTVTNWALAMARRDSRNQKTLLKKTNGRQKAKVRPPFLLAPASQQTTRRDKAMRGARSSRLALPPYSAGSLSAGTADSPAHAGQPSLARQGWLGARSSTPPQHLTPRPSRHKTNTKPTAADNSLRCAPMASAGVERPSIPSHLHGGSIYVGWGLLAQAPPSPSPQRLVRSSSSLPSPLNWSAGPWSRQKANWGSQHDGTDC